MRIAILGAGSVGGYFGGRLSESGEDVVFIARGDHLNLPFDWAQGGELVEPFRISGLSGFGR